jgi:thioesterase domain-containing protein
MLGVHLPAADATQLPVPYKFEEIAAALVSRLREAQPQGPYYIAGLCVNGVVAYEMARQLHDDGQEVALLALFDAQNPEYYQDFSQEGRALVLFRKTRFHLTKLWRHGLGGLPDFFWGRLAGISLRLSVLRWRTHHALGFKVAEKHLRELDTIVHPASYLYRPKPYPGKVIFFQSTDWPACRYFDFYASWDGVVTGDFEVHKIAGGHQSMFYEENVEVVASKLRACLSAVQEQRVETVKTL